MGKRQTAGLQPQQHLALPVQPLLQVRRCFVSLRWWAGFALCYVPVWVSSFLPPFCSVHHYVSLKHTAVMGILLVLDRTCWLFCLLVVLD